MPQQSEPNPEELKSAVLQLGAYLRWPAFPALNIAAGEEHWTQTVSVMQREAPLVRLLGACTLQIDQQAAASLGTDAARQGDTQAGNKARIDQ